ncbi:conserved exported hypothetical protein [Cupriavidus necator]|uniref:Tripartite tricarboxylate transporter substrate binding protein n=1 Tax=Cupriavidus necator TaxID=106590 RepID=A0A1K0ILV0_CUPNE|nr:conserved exported hypothetical protein [Cupriavidus necator]
MRGLAIRARRKLPALLAGLAGLAWLHLAALAQPAAAQAYPERPVRIVSPARVSVLKDVPTVAEAGMPDASFNSWVGLFAPAGTPPAVVDKLARLRLDFVNSPEATAHYAARGVVPYPANGAELRKTIAEDQQSWKRMIALAGIEPE